MYDFFRMTEIVKDVGLLDVQVGDVLTMKKQHPCGANEMLVMRSGMDFRLRCVGCGREFMVPRSKIEKSIKRIKREND